MPANIDPMKVLLVLTWFGTAYIAFVYRGSLSFVSYEDVYAQRSATEALGKDVFTAYFGAWLANVFIPFSASYGLFAKKKLYYISAVVASIIFYMATADKAILLFPFIILGIYRFLRNKDLKNSFSAIGLGFSGIMMITLATGFSIIAALFWMRTIGNGGLLTRLYQEFFMNHKTTYFSHVNIINALTQSYPYGNRGIGQVVGQQYYTKEMNANANFWATDGIASFGDSGIIVASIIFFFILLWFNKITSRYNKVFIICVLIPFISSLLNQSLFSSLLTGGGFWIMFILSFKSTLHNKFINENSNNIRGEAPVH
ncbi:hypothetical protein MHJ94_03940 [Chryseobacterium taklimakanense]|uniref:hypothetical protein n=1 Tax=Chryseobacterium taklimakanense TaxID=536441 RepID=UPI001EF72FE4|nr:hypothetical protein [Chryseobacterium taklimakanense]MCG7280442.1 hypothetical protein [Chryseobacterium taklimakanense]